MNLIGGRKLFKKTEKLLKSRNFGQKIELKQTEKLLKSRNFGQKVKLSSIYLLKNIFIRHIYWQLVRKKF